MGLDFTSIPDREGPAVYILHTGRMLEMQTFERLRDEIAKHCANQVELLDVQTADGEQVRDFYDILPEQLPAILLVRDDDSLIQLWTGNEIPGADVISYNLQQDSAV